MRRLLLGFLSAVGILTASAPVRAVTLEGLDAIASRASSLDDFLSRPDLVRAYGNALTEYYGRDHFRCESYDAILTRLREIKDKVPGLKDRLWRKERLGALSFSALADDEGKHRESETRYEFKPVPRRFHGLWNDPSRQGCLSDDCRESDPAAPMRWAIALSDSRLYLLERGGQFADASVLLLPVKRAGETLGLVVLSGSPLLRRSALYRDTASGNGRTTTLVDLWSEAVGKEGGPWKSLVERLPEGAGDSLASLYPRSSKLQGEARQLEPIDPMAQGLTSALPKRCFAGSEKSTKDLLAGAAVPLLPGETTTGGTTVVTLTPEQEQARELLLQFDSPSELGKLGLLAERDPEGIAILLENALKNDPDAGIRARAALAIQALDSVNVPFHDGAPSGRQPGFRISSEPMRRALRNALSDPDPQVSALAALALARHGKDKPSQDLLAPMAKALEPGSLRFFFPPPSPTRSASPSTSRATAQREPATPAASSASSTAPKPATTGSSSGTATGTSSSAGSGAGGDKPPASGGGTGTRPANPMDQIDALGRQLEAGGVALSQPTLEALMDQVAAMDDPTARGRAEGKLAQLVLRNPDPHASVRAVHAGLGRHPSELALFPEALNEAGSRQCPLGKEKEGEKK